MSDSGETQRLATLNGYQILDTPAEAGFDDIVRIASEVCETPVALVSFVSFDRQWFKAAVGFDGCETPLDQSVCAHVVAERRLIVIPDLTQDPRTWSNTLVTQPPRIRFYAGAPLETPGGEILGALCVIDDQPRPAGLTDRQADTLLALSRQVMTQLELRRLLRENLEQSKQLADLQNEELAARTGERDRLWRNSQDLLVTLDKGGVFQSVNPAVTTVLGWSPEDMIGRNVLDFILHDDVPLTLQALENAREDALPVVENRYRHKEGGFRWISWVASPEGDLIFASGRHVTVEKEQAETLKAVEESLRQSQKMEAVGQLTGGLAHDFNNLLTGITGSLEFIQVRLTQGRLDDIGRYIHAAQGAAQRAAALTHRLLAFSRRQALDPKPINVNRLILNMEDLIRRTVGPAIDVEVVGAAGLWTTLADPNQLENALLNLCINARDAMPDGGRITIETANKWLDDRSGRERDMTPGQYLSLCVTDTGTGMTPEVVARAFDPFFTTKPLGRGTGLGLSMIYGFARQSGGQVRAYSEPGQGTTMCIYLPRHVGNEQAPDVAEGAREPAPAMRTDRTVLVIDDDPTVRMLIVEILEDAGFAAIEASEGALGLDLLRSNVRVDLLITDVGLPGGMNGRQVADAARMVRPELDVLFITGYAENAVVGNGHLDPGMSLLTKPFTMEALAAKVREITRS